jgi:hypothetical protein
MRIPGLIIVACILSLNQDTLRAAGEPDPDFGTDGEVTTNISGLTDGALAVAL